MKKITRYAALAIVALLTLASCEDKASQGLTDITYYAEIVLEGEETMVVNKGDAYVEPGFSATMKGEDVTEQVVVEGELDTNTSGIYTISYSVTNADGFVASATRTIVVYNLSDPVEGFWVVDPTISYRDYDNSGEIVTTPYTSAFEIFIYEEEPGVYMVDDLLAGWYCQGAGYGTSYAMMAYISIADDGTIALLDSFVPGWGDAADELTDGVFNAANGTIKYTIAYAGIMKFYVTLNKE